MTVAHQPVLGQATTRWPLYVKRAVATAGDPVPESVAEVLTVAPGTPVRPGALLVLGDNATNSYDSRVFGYVHPEQLVGVVLRPIGALRPVS
ncbi:MAG: hypothetical protein HOV76_25475 [Hamadaea sp.]|nr:hypothetical protein [Hamadaea sp.]